MLKKSDTIFFVSSFGGHSTQLGILKKQLKLPNGTRSLWIGTSNLADKYDVVVPDCHGKLSMHMVRCVISAIYICIRYRPKLVISTGALPGLIIGTISRFFGAKFIWIDSIANIKELSISGTYALKFANEIYSQWPEVAEAYDRVEYHGSIFQ